MSRTCKVTTSQGKRVSGVRTVAGVAVALVSSLASVAGAQESTSAPLASELAATLTEKGLDSIAAKDTVDENRYVAALAFPGQLLVVSAQYEAPAAADRKISNGDYREVYIDLNAASIAGTKILITDSGGNGLHADGDLVDVVTTDALTLRLDGDRSGRSMSGEDYRSAATDADQQYARMLSALIAQAQ